MTSLPTGKTFPGQSVLVFEWLCGGGLLLDGIDPEQCQSLVRQGQQMLTAVCADLCAAEVNLIVPLDHRIKMELEGQIVAVTEGDSIQTCLVSLATAADQILVIAPETGERLVICLQWLESQSTKLLNPSFEFTRMCCNKNELQRYLSDSSIPVPFGVPANEWSRIAIAGQQDAIHQNDGWIVKPNDGAGGEGIKFGREFNATLPLTSKMRIEQFVPGLPVSVSVVCQAGHTELMPALRQEFDDDPVGCFVRCVDDLDSDTSSRARQLAAKVVEALPSTIGFFGIDMIIGDRDVVIEINPRITMSYPVLRDKLGINLTKLMLGTSKKQLEFDAS